MGTSTSYRAPLRARWQAFVAALVGHEGVDRIRSELFNAGNEWQEALAAAPIASYAESLVSLHREFAERLEGSGRPDLALSAVIADARSASHEAGFSPAAAIADRAFGRVLLEALQGVTDVGPNAVKTVADRWRASRSDDPNDLVVRFAGEVLGQYARHVVDREAGRLALEQGARASASTSEVLAQLATQIGRSSAAEALQSTQSVRGAWTKAVDDAFTKGRTLPPPRRR
jgi:hypothetical protein